MIMDPAMAREKGVAFYRPCTVLGMNKLPSSGEVNITLTSPDGEMLRGFKHGHLAVPEDAGWLPLHLAVAEGREEGVVRPVRDAWPEAVGIGPRVTCYDNKNEK